MVSAVGQGPFSKSARRGAPQLFRFMFKDKLGVYFAVKVAHPRVAPMQGHSDLPESRFG
jgi:hypothetical protein